MLSFLVLVRVSVLMLGLNKLKENFVCFLMSANLNEKYEQINSLIDDEKYDELRMFLDENELVIQVSMVRCLHSNPPRHWVFFVRALKVWDLKNNLFCKMSDGRYKRTMVHSAIRKLIENLKGCSRLRALSLLVEKPVTKAITEEENHRALESLLGKTPVERLIIEEDIEHFQN